MYVTKAGQKFGSSFVGKKKDAMHPDAGEESKPEPKNPFAGAKPATGAPKPPMSADHEAQESPEFEQGEQEGAEETPGVAEGKQVAAEHGPAHTVTIKSDHKTGRNTVVSHHSDGHSHQSSHESAEDAHNTGKALAGVSDAPPEQEQSQGPQEPESDGFSLPSLG